MTETSPSSVPPTTQPSAAKPADPVKTEPAKIIETKVVEVRKAGFFPMLLGGVVAAGLGAGAPITRSRICPPHGSPSRRSMRRPKLTRHAPPRSKPHGPRSRARARNC
ncbi:hypothetical protein QWZ10_16490 [Paracoccus cavernae]|uniref:Uncharacterized protein n=1 Tax=Paracoccus cavernae TaxID=1571207 RepID=A0ABT8DC76_9RHOB|nr:hypothetical protein [Paracoccus cavernae]